LVGKKTLSMVNVVYGHGTGPIVGLIVIIGVWTARASGSLAQATTGDWQTAIDVRARATSFFTGQALPL
jgi:hypothetical protein